MCKGRRKRQEGSTRDEQGIEETDRRVRKRCGRVGEKDRRVVKKMGEVGGNREISTLTNDFASKVLVKLFYDLKITIHQTAPCLQSPDLTLAKRGGKGSSWKPGNSAIPRIRRTIDTELRAV